MSPQYTFESLSAIGFPPMVQLTINNKCQLDCFHCPQQVYAKSVHNDGSEMSLDLFAKIAGEMGGHPDSALRIFSRGEPLLHPKIIDMIRFAKLEARLPLVSVITNGMLLQGRIAQAFVESGLDVVEVSLDALTEESYRTVRPLAGETARRHKSAFNTVVRNVLDYISLRDKLNPNCKIVVSIIDQPLVSHEVDEFIAYWQQRVDRVLRRTFHSFQGRVAGIQVPEERHPCRVLWARFNVHSNGNVPLCYNDWRNEETLGNLTDPGTTIAGLWHHPVYESYRAGQLRGEYQGICAGCRDWTGASWGNPYEKVFVNILPANGVVA